MTEGLAERLAASLVSVRTRQHTDYSQAIRAGKLDTVWETFRIPEKLPRSTLKLISDRAGIPVDTLRTWRHKIKTNPDWRPDPHRTGVGLKLSQEVESRIANRIRSEFVDQSRYCPPTLVQRLARFEATSIQMQDIEETTQMAENEFYESFKASSSWRRRFLKRHRFSIRRFHAKKRTSPDDDLVSSFLNDWEVARLQFSFDHLLNADETSWRVLHNHMCTIANTGAEEVTCTFSCDEKACITVMAAIRRDGSKLPLWVIAKGLTDRSLKKMRQDERLKKEIRYGNLRLSFSKNGWMDSDVAKQYLEWLSELNKGYDQFLIWDVYPSHRSQDVKEKAREVKIHLSFVPSGQTGTWQPLDYRVFGSLKARAKERFDAAVAASILKGEQREWGLNDALAMLTEVWKSLPQEEILNSWSRLG